MLSFIAGFLFIVWFLGSFLPWVFKNWLTLAGFALIFIALGRITGERIL